jgi:proline dehydrogenase
MAVLDRAIVRLLPAVPRPVVKRLSRRYIAGDELSEACRVVKRLNEDGKLATLDVLGEEVTTREEALALVEAYRDVFETIRREELDSNVSVKPTGLGLSIDRNVCRQNLVDLVRCAEERSNFVRIDMEDASTTSDTLEVYRELRAEGLSSVGVVLQARLRRTLDDISALADLRPNVRVCKGIYLEPPDIAYQGMQAIRENFVKAIDDLLEAGASVAVANTNRGGV